MKILIINGPNINMLGIREPEIYGRISYADLCKKINEYAEANNIDVEIFQSNHEGALIDKIQQAYAEKDAIVINPGAYTHTSIALLDALKAVGLPAVEVHISKVNEREAFRHVSYTGKACIKSIIGHGTEGYIEAIAFLKEKASEKKCR